jgi:hypothetical protein
LIGPPLLRFASLQRPSAASRFDCPKVAGLRTWPASAFGRRFAPYVTRTDRSDTRPCGFSL